MKRADTLNPTLIRVTSSGETIGHLTCKEFREWMNDQTAFVPALVERFNEGKARIGEPERVEQVLNAR